MKKLIYLIPAMMTVLIIACNSGKDKAIAGVYVTAFKNEYSIANDTLVITAYNLEAHTYKIERHSGFHRIREGKVQPKENKLENWMATYDRSKQALEDALGRQLYVNPDKRTISFGATYQKIE